MTTLSASTTSDLLVAILAAQKVAAPPSPAAPTASDLILATHSSDASAATPIKAERPAVRT